MAADALPAELPHLTFAHTTWDWSRPYIAGVLNVTPDSFSDGGELGDLDAALRRAEMLVADGADLIDVGGESTRPGSVPVSVDAELSRVLPVIEALVRACDVPISVDTTKAAVAQAALQAGALVVNDISGGIFDPRVPGVVATLSGVYICGHLRGRSIADVHGSANEVTFEGVVADLEDQLSRLPDNLRARTIIDPGLGFGKSADINLLLCNRAGDLAGRLKYPVMVGPSRKRFVAAASAVAEADRAVRDSATMGACLAAVESGAHILRVHNVAALAPALRTYCAVRGAG